MSLIEKYRRLSQLPRREDRAKIHMIGPDVMGEEWEDFLDNDEDIVHRIRNYLEAIGDTDIRRGDVFVVEDDLNEDEQADSGKFSALSPTRFVRWEIDYEGSPEVRFLPTELQVTEEFPLHYWDEVFDNPREMYVPFHYWDHFRGVVEDLVIEPLADDPDRLGTSFVARDGKTYYIISKSGDSVRSFRKSINDLEYYEIKNNRADSEYDYDAILFVPGIVTPTPNLF